ncbi:MAG: hypothetical protein ABEJ31_03490 [Haloarculaceae archaeon]
MATASARRLDTESLGRAGALVAVCTLVLTASFVGLVAMLSGQAPGIADRLPVYVLGMAGAFVGTIVLFETQGQDGHTIMVTAGGAAVGTFIVLTLGGEGVMAVLRDPSQVVASQLLFYFLAAGMIGTGLGFWAINHWQEFSLASGRGSTTSFKRN